jgi:flagellar basal-body rod protein FlgF
MDRLVHTAFSGMRSAMLAQTVTAQNLANANTTGFRRDSASSAARAIENRQSFGSRFQAAEEILTPQMAPGSLLATGRALDIALTGDAYLAVQAPDGTDAYTRRGDLRLAVTGVLETGDGHVVLGNAGPITLPPADQVMIAPDGTVSIQPKGGTIKDIAIIDRVRLVTSEDASFVKTPDNLLVARDGQSLEPDTSARLVSGTLESSNVNMASELVQMIDHARAYEMQVKMLTTARDLDQASTALMRLEN